MKYGGWDRQMNKMYPLAVLLVQEEYWRHPDKADSMEVVVLKFEG